MKRRAAKAGLIFLEILGVAVAAVAALAVFLFWRLEQGPVSINLFAPSAEFAVGRILAPGHGCDIEELTLSRGPARGEYEIAFSNISIFGPSGEQTAALPRVSVVFAPKDLLKGAAGPRRILAENPKIRVVRSADLAVGVELPDGGNEKSAGKFFRILTSGGLFRQAFERAVLTGADITFFDEASGRSWSAPDAGVEIIRDDRGYTARAESAFEMDGRSASFDLNAQYTEGSGVVSVSLDGKDVPLGDLLAMFYGEHARVATATVSGSAAIAFTSSGKVLSSRFDGRAEGGALSVAGLSGPIEFVDIAAGFDPAHNQFDVDRLAFDIAGNRGELSGSIMISVENAPSTPARITFDLEGRDLLVSAEGVLPEPLPIEKAHATGGYDIAARRLSLGAVSANFLGVVVAGSVEYKAPKTEGDDARKLSPGVKAELRLDGGLDPERLLRVWPLGLAMGGRDWIKGRLERGKFENLVLAMDLKPGAIGEDGGLPDEALTLTFDVSDIVAHFIEGMTPLTRGAGAGVLRGNSFKLDARTARVGPIAISGGEVDFPVFMPKWLPTYFRFTAKGDAGDMLAILNEEPLSLLDKVSFAPAQFSGKTQARIEISRPNKRDVLPEEYGYSGKATFEDLSVSEFYAAADLTDATGQVDLKTRRMTVSGSAKLGGSPIDLLWTENFYEEDGPSSFHAKGVVDSSTGDIFGIPTRQFLRGPVKFEAQAHGRIDAIEDLKIDADFTDAALKVDLLGWRKPQGLPAVGFLNLSAGASGVDIHSLNLVGHGVDINGALSFDEAGAIKSAEFKRIKLDEKADLILSANRSGADALNIELIGKYLDASVLLETLIDGSSGAEGGADEFDWGAGLILRTRIDRLDLRTGVKLRDASLDFWRDRERLQELEFSALNPQQLPVSVSLDQMGEETGPSQKIIARTDDIGSLMGGLFGIESMKGGQGVMEIRLGDKSEKGLKGAIEARGMRVVNASLLARIFAAGSLTGLADLVNGEGIALDTAFADFNYVDGIFKLHDARASGPSVGITAQGEIATSDNGGVNLNGAVAPAYQVNSVLGKIPGVGDLFVSREGEGIVALSYQVSGPVDAPTVFVNPLSALTPGVLRRIFDPFRRDGVGEPVLPEPSPAVEEAAPDAGQ